MKQKRSEKDLSDLEIFIPTPATERMDKSLESFRQKIEWLEEVNRELLEACKAIQRAGTAYLKEDSGWMTLFDYADRKARQAIAKAKGK